MTRWFPLFCMAVAGVNAWVISGYQTRADELAGKVAALQTIQTELEHRLTLENEQMLYRVKMVHESCRRQCVRKCGVNI